MDELRHGKKVHIMGFGMFFTYETAERTVKNPWNGELMTIPSKRVPKFKPGETFRNCIAEGQKGGRT